MALSTIPNKKFLLIFIGCFFISTFPLSAQNDPAGLPQEQEKFWSNVRFGGSLGLNFGSGRFLGALSPSAIYDFNKTISAGVGLSGAYSSQNNFTATSLGGSIIGMLRPIKEIQLSTEYEILSITRKLEYDGANLKEQDWVPALFLGIGYNAGPVVTGIRYDVLHDDEKSFYSSAFMPFVSIYF